MFSRSPAAYEALKSFRLLQLPFRSTLQAYTGAFLHDAGSSSDSISDQVAQFVVHDTERVKRGSMPSKKAGIFFCVAIVFIAWLHVHLHGYL